MAIDTCNSYNNGSGGYKETFKGEAYNQSSLL